MTLLSRCHLTIFNRWYQPWAFRVCSSRVENRPGANRTRPLWAEFIFALNTRLRGREGVFEYCHQPDCILRGLMSKPQLSDINIIRAITNLDSLHRIAARHGFTAIRDPVNPSLWEHVHRFGQNILYWLLTLACHSGRARPGKFSRTRQVIYLSRRGLDCKYIAAARGHNHDV